MQRRVSFLVVALMLSSAAEASPLVGTWGGDRMILAATASGARVKTDCAAGAISGPIELHRDGTFEAMGSFERYRGGPQRADEDVQVPGASYSGKLDSGTLTLNITTTADRVRHQFVLRRGAAVKLVRCL